VSLGDENKVKQNHEYSVLAGLSDTMLLMICHFGHGEKDKDDELLAAAGEELFGRGVLTAPRYTVETFNREKLYERGGAWRDQLYECITGDEDTVEGHFYRKVLGLERPEFPELKLLEHEDAQAEKLANAFVSGFANWTLAVLSHVAADTELLDGAEDFIEALNKEMARRGFLGEHGLVNLDSFDTNELIWTCDAATEALDSLTSVLSAVHERLAHLAEIGEQQKIAEKEHPPARVLELCEQLDAAQKSWLLSRLAEEIDHNTVECLNSLKLTPALEKFVAVEMAQRGLETDAGNSSLAENLKPKITQKTSGAVLPVESGKSGSEET
jgi:hypothetical protein